MRNAHISEMRSNILKILYCRATTARAARVSSSARHPGVSGTYLIRKITTLMKIDVFIFYCCIYLALYSIIIILI